MERPATLGADGYWHVRDVPLPYPGRWHMRIDALVTDFEKITLEDDFDVALALGTKLSAKAVCDVFAP